MHGLGSALKARPCFPVSLNEPQVQKLLFQNQGEGRDIVCRFKSCYMACLLVNFCNLSYKRPNRFWHNDNAKQGPR